MDIYEHPKSSEWFERATKVIPGGIYGHLGPAEGCFMPISAYPLYLDHAQGSHFWDIDKQRSYRELPLRLFEFGTVYRNEKSGVLHGLTLSLIHI